jgi:hypothetical protein
VCTPAVLLVEAAAARDSHTAPMRWAELALCCCHKWRGAWHEQEREGRRRRRGEEVSGGAEYLGGRVVEEASTIR